MLLCDIGNTSLHFYDGSRDFKHRVEDFDPASIIEEVFFISVNPHLEGQLKTLSNWHDIRGYVPWEKYYETMGIDRAVACEAVDEGIIIDAGSAVTVDVVRDGAFQGGFIYPGADAMQKSYSDISMRLDYSFNFELDLDKMPKNSRDAISYGYLRLLKSEVSRHDGPIYLTGGDAQRFAKIFPEAMLESRLLFKGMKKILESRC